MAGQEQQRHHRRDERDEANSAPAPAPAAEVRERSDSDEIDALLDEIDGTLEQNAESFVRGFVQKGGQ